MRRQKKFYAWGYADEDLSPDEIKPWEAEIAQRYGLSGFDVTPPPKTDEITLRKPRVEVPAALQAMVRIDHLTRLEHSYGKAGFDALRMFMRSVPNPPDAVAFPETEQDVVAVLDWCGRIGATAIPYGGGSSVVKGIEPAASFDKVVTISLRHMDKVLEVDTVSHAARIQGGIYGPAIEDALRDTPFTMRHYMQAYRCSTLGGWIATAEGLPKVGGLAVHALVFMVLSTLIWRYVPIGSSRFAEDEKAEEFESKLTGAELFNQPDPSKMHAGVYH